MPRRHTRPKRIRSTTNSNRQNNQTTTVPTNSRQNIRLPNDTRRRQNQKRNTTRLQRTNRKNIPNTPRNLSSQKRMGVEEPKFKIDVNVGSPVKITDGPFKDMEGKVADVDEERGKIKVLVSMFGRETPVELDSLQIRKL